MSSAVANPPAAAGAPTRWVIAAAVRPPLKKFRVVHGTHTQDDPRYAHFNFRAPSGAEDSPWEEDRIVPTGGGIQVIKTPRLPFGHPDSPYEQDGQRKSKTYESFDFVTRQAEKFGTPPPGPGYKGDVFESPFDMVKFDPEKFALVTDPYADETPASRVARLKQEIAELEAAAGTDAPAAPAADGKDDLDDMTFEELKKYAAELKINFGKVKDKTELVGVIREALLKHGA